MKLKLMSEAKDQESFSQLYLSSRLMWGFTVFSTFRWNECFVAHRLTFDTPLLVLLVNEQVAGRVWEEGEGDKLNESGKCIGCHENGPESIYSEKFPGRKPAERELLSNHVWWLCEHTWAQGGPLSLLPVSWQLSLGSLQHFSATNSGNLGGKWQGRAACCACSPPSTEGCQLLLSHECSKAGWSSCLSWGPPGVSRIPA